jgi:hypothetical protein
MAVGMADRVSCLSRGARPEKVGYLGLLLGHDWATRKTSQVGPAREPSEILARGHSREKKTL